VPVATRHRAYATKISGLTAILGLNAYHADAAAAIVVDGELVAAAEEERFDRIKHVAGFPALAAAWCLEEAGVAARELHHIAVSRDPRANIGHDLLRSVRHGASARYLKASLDNAAKPRDVKAALEQVLGLDEGTLPARLHDVEHHQAHIASAFFVSPFDEAAILSADAFGDFASTITAIGRGNSYDVLERVLFPHSLGIFYAAFTQWLGFEHYGDEGKVMGLASYGDPSPNMRRMRDALRTSGDLFVLDLDYFTHDKEGVDMTWDAGMPHMARIFSDKFVETFGPPREPDGEVTKHFADVAASLQERLEEVYLHVVDRLQVRTGSTNLCLAGGVALNAVANGRIRPETGFDEIFIQPATSDAGSAVGAAYYVWNQELHEPRSFVMRHANTGPEYGDALLSEAIRAAGHEPQRLDDDALFPVVAERIAAGDVVGWFQGRMELGPRALGHRSIVADPRNAEMKEILNARIKHREPFRPFGASILAEATGEWFEQDYPSPFMVLVYKIRPDKRPLIPAVSHVDNTGRVQTVEREDDPRYYRLIEEFGRQTGVPILLNTSFNENEPIVMTPADALDTFQKTTMDVLVLGNYVLRRNGTSA
jgi:carbamoyltransferase